MNEYLSEMSWVDLAWIVTTTIILVSVVVLLA